jgi:hypothetical protein
MVTGLSGAMAELETKRARLAVVEHELAEVVAHHDLAMSAFKFDEAREMQQRIAALEEERAELAAALPAVAPPPPSGPLPVMIRGRPGQRRRLLRR